MQRPAHVIDIMATCLDVAGADYPKSFRDHPIHPLDGKSLLPIFENDQPIHESLCWEHHGNRAIRKGDWKLSAVRGGAWELYDLASDRTETRNLAGQHPEVVSDLSSIYQNWADECGVLPADELEIKELSGAKNPLARDSKEIETFLKTINNTLRQRGLAVFENVE